MKKRTKGVLAAALAAAGVFLLAGLDARLLVRAYTVESGRLTGPVRLAVLTDLHACAYGEGQRELLDAVAEQSPDLVLLCGDIVDDEPRMPEARALDTVEALAAVWPTYYVTGNHEFWTGRVDEVKARLEERGAVVLAGDCVTVTAAGQTVQLCGIDDPSVGETRWREQLEAVTAALDGEHCSILMTHRPERTEDYAGRGFELVLAGHAHGGQWRLPGLLNGLFAPDQGLFPTYAGGRYALGDTTLLVSRGLARESTRLPRFYNRPELVMVELRPGLEEFPAKKNEVKILFLTFGAYCRGKIGNTPSLFVQIHGFCFRAQKGVVRREVFGYNRTDNLGTKGVMQKMKATLILENGMTFAGRSIGSGEERICEMVFNTSMTGYQEILTDPSYAGQGIVMSYPLIGNYGVNHEDNESTRPWAEAFIVRHLARRGSNFRCEDGLDSYLKQFHITGIEGVDTRALTRILRSQGTMNGMITCAEHFSVPECLERIRAYRVEGTVERVTRREAQVYPALGERRLRVALMDYGVKENMIRCLQNRGCEVTVFPARTPAEAVLSGGFDGVMLSNGPGDPADNVEIITEVRKLYESELPLFAVCLGHQLLALATGAETRKMRFGHRGGNHPVKDLEHGRAYITSQNHGYVVTAESVDPAVAEVSHINVNEGSVEGLRYRRPNCFTVQFHPEAAPGPMDTEYLFDRFVDSMKGGRAHA